MFLCLTLSLVTKWYVLWYVCKGLLLQAVWPITCASHLSPRCAMMLALCLVALLVFAVFLGLCWLCKHVLGRLDVGMQLELVFLFFANPVGYLILQEHWVVLNLSIVFICSLV